MTPSDAIGALKSQLEADTTLKTYIKEVFLGVRDRISVFPCIVIEPLSISERNESYDRNDLDLQVAIIAYIQEENAEKQIVGDATHKGILEVENDVKKAVSLIPTLGGYAIDTTLQESHFEFVNYPIRSVSIGATIFIRQSSKVRT